jgi:hypothetical protein
MSWKNVMRGVVGVALVGAAYGGLRDLVGQQQPKGISPDAYAAGVTTEFKAYSAQLPKKIEGRDGQPMTVLAVQMDGRTITYVVRYDDKDELDGVDGPQWDLIRVITVAGICTEKATRKALEHNFRYVYRLHDHTGAFRKELPAIGVADCANVT